MHAADIFTDQSTWMVMKINTHECATGYKLAEQRTGVKDCS